MTVPTEVRSVTLLGNGSLTQFAYPYRIHDEDHLEVTLIAVGGGETLQTIVTHYSVAGVLVDAGGTVTMVTAPASGENLRIERTPPIKQLLDLRNQGSFLPENHEQEFDEIIQIIQAARDGAYTSLTTDSDAIHDNVASEISAITLKATPVGADHLLIEDSAAANVKKRVLLSALLGGAHDPKLMTYTDSPDTKPAASAANDGVVYKVRASDGFERVEYIYQESGGATYERGIIHHASS